MIKFTDRDPRTRGYMLRRILKGLPPHLRETARQFRRSSTLKNWKTVRHILVVPEETLTVWAGVEFVNGERLSAEQKPTKLQFDYWLYVFYWIAQKNRLTRNF